MNYEGASGRVDFDVFGDVTSGVVEVWRIEDGAIVTDRTEFVDFDEDADWVPVPLVARCQLVTSTEDLEAATLRDRFDPKYNSAWLLDAASGRWLGDFPAAGAAMQGPNDLPGVGRLEAFFACMPEGGGTFERAIV